MKINKKTAGIALALALSAATAIPAFASNSGEEKALELTASTPATMTQEIAEGDGDTLAFTKIESFDIKAEMEAVPLIEATETTVAMETVDIAEAK